MHENNVVGEKSKKPKIWHDLEVICVCVNKMMSDLSSAPVSYWCVLFQLFSAKKLQRIIGDTSTCVHNQHNFS